MTTRETRVESAFRSIRVALSLKGDTAFGDYCYEGNSWRACDGGLGFERERQ